jgi:type I restriction enzyme M protein
MTTLTNNSTLTASGATVGYEAQLGQMADALRGSMDAAEYKHVVRGLIFLKYISEASTVSYLLPRRDTEA